jgi:vesicle-associated membrane protein 7
VIERGERIELLVNKTESMQQQAFKFKTNSKSLAHAMWWKNFKLTLLIVVIVVVSPFDCYLYFL